jgi:GNAT superfamily N-acetyltransferase
MRICDHYQVMMTPNRVANVSRACRPLGHSEVFWSQHPHPTNQQALNEMTVPIIGFEAHYAIRGARGRRSLVRVDIGNLKMESVGKGDFPLFSFLEFRFFWNSPDGKAMPMLFGNPAWLAPLIVVPYMLAALVYNFGGAKYFIKLRNEVAGILILKRQQDVLILRTLAVSPMYRKHGVGLFILERTENLARRTKMQWLELEVLKHNIPAQRLYERFRFKIHVTHRLSLVLRKRV